MMYRFIVRDENGDKYAYKASDMRAALVVHHMYHNTDVVKAIRKNPTTQESR